jgi:hypothetical protein
LASVTGAFFQKSAGHPSVPFYAQELESVKRTMPPTITAPTATPRMTFAIYCIEGKSYNLSQPKK